MAESFSILDKKPCPQESIQRPAFYLDLNLNQIIDYVTAQWDKKVRGFYYRFPYDEECVIYRREIYGDVKKQPLFVCLCSFIERIHGMAEAGKNKERVVSPLQKNMWHLQEMDAYCKAFDYLAEGLKTANLQSDGMKDFQKLLDAYLESEKYKAMKKDVQELLQNLLNYRFVITYEKDRMIISEGSAEGEYEAFLKTDGFGEEKPLKNPFQANGDLTDLERACIDILMQKKPDLFKAVQEKATLYANYANAELMQFVEEIPFYMSFWQFQKSMMEKGYVFSAPTMDENRKMEAIGLYDLALACAASKEERNVVCNNMDYRDGESFFVLTGPNQGGKTTFARSLGQLVYFTKMGLDVPADSANVHYFKDILTHFSVEESVETGRGKLKEELIRLAPMMEETRANHFVVINELFTTAATYDAEIMGRKVLEHFIGAGCRGIYVTHLKELASVHPKVVSLRAMLNEERIQTFKIARSEAQESACAVNQVNKYRLTYEQLKERL